MIKTPSKTILQRAGETLAAERLLDEGFDSVETNVQVGRYELDVVAERGQELVICEVRTRSSNFVDPLATIQARKAKCITRAAERLLSERPHIQSIRLDAAGVRWSAGRGSSGYYQLDYRPRALQYAQHMDTERFSIL